MSFLILFFTVVLINNIVTHTNSYAYEHIETHQSYAKSDGSWQEATADEIRRLIAILIYFGLVRVSDAVDNYLSARSLYLGLWGKCFLSRIRFKRSLHLNTVDHFMFWAACTLAYFSFLRSSEFTVSLLSAFNPSCHLQVKDVSVGSAVAPMCLKLCIKASKTDPFRRGTFIHIGQAKPPLCTLDALLQCLNLRGDSPGPLFLLQSGQPRSLLTSCLRQIMDNAGIQGNFSSHSFQIGAATVAARYGEPDHQIQTLGRWSSNAYQLYI